MWADKAVRTVFVAAAMSDIIVPVQIFLSLIHVPSVVLPV